jgi:predicted PurR-regulated permease PerM
MYDIHNDVVPILIGRYISLNVALLLQEVTVGIRLHGVMGLNVWQNMTNYKRIQK